MLDSYDVSETISIMERLNRSWDQRAAVRNGTIESAPGFDETMPDYPEAIVPFLEHPCFMDHEQPLRERLLSHGWLNYNNSTITAEETVANPAFALMLAGTFPGLEHESIRLNIIQSLVDEHYHLYMHARSNYVTVKGRGLESFTLPHSKNHRELVKHSAQLVERWERQLLTFIWAVVSEVSINAYLNLIAQDKTIQPLNSRIAAAHNKDELSHAKICVEASQIIYHSLNRKERNFFNKYLPIAFMAFSENDYEVWRATLHALGFRNADEIISDCEAEDSKKTLVRDCSGVRSLTERLGITDQISIDVLDS